MGEDSPIANIAGIRSDVVAALRRLRVPVLRWPGGCYADDYHWEDGIGPRKDRPRRVNLHWGQTIEDGAFGTHEFIQLCRLIGAEPYIAGNLGSGGVREMRDWMEYCNFARRQHPGPPARGQWIGAAFRGPLLGRGKRKLGLRRKLLPGRLRGGVQKIFHLPARIWRNDSVPGRVRAQWESCGVDQPILQESWGITAIFMGLGRTTMSGTKTGGTARRREFSTAQYYGLLADSLAMEELIVAQRKLMDEFDPQRRDRAAHR